jgi:hypothetical protein
MIKITKAKESRKRDKKRDRYLLQIGNKKFHLTIEEINTLYYTTQNIIAKYIYNRSIYE